VSAADLVARYFEMWNSGDTSAAAEILAPDWVDHAHPEITGPADVAAAVTRVRAARPGLRFDIEAYLEEGASEPDAPEAALVAAVGGRLLWLVRVRDGRLAEMWTYQRTDG
jgi:ketosteroid isomerase-like protein